MINLNFQISDESFELLKEINSKSYMEFDCLSILIYELENYDLIETNEDSFKIAYRITDKGKKVVIDNTDKGKKVVIDNTIKSIIDLYLDITITELEQTIDNYTPNKLLIISSMIGYLKGVKIALEKGADINYKDNQKFLTTALNYACYYGHSDIVEFLLEFNATIDDKTMHNAYKSNVVSSGDMTIVKLLKSYIDI